MGAYRYRLGGRNIASDRPLQNIAAPPARGARTDISIRTAHAREAAPACREWFHAWVAAGGSTILRFGRVAGGYLLEAPRRAKFVVLESGDRIVGYPSRGLVRSAYQHLLLDQVLPLALGLKGDLVLHASAVVSEGRTIAFAGASGRGKSTLAAHLAARGAQVLTDDCFVLREVRGAWRAYAFDQGIRLSERSAQATLREPGEGGPVSEGSSKRRILRHAALRFRQASAPLGAIVLLEPRRRALCQPVLAPLAAREAMIALLPVAFFFEVDCKPALSRQFELLGRLVECARVFGLEMPARLGELRTAGDALRAAVAH